MTNVYVVWGPTAAWGDGNGPLYYASTFKDAASYVRDERRITIEHAFQIVDTDDDGLTVSFSDREAMDRLEGRALYDVASKLVGWPMNVTPYWINCEDRATLLQATGFDGDASDDDAVFDFLNSEG